MKRQGFSLIELSIVLIIIGLIISGSLKYLNTMQDKGKITASKRDVLTAKEAILGYAITAGTLPTISNFRTNLSPVKGNQHQLLYVYDNILNSSQICSIQSTSLSINLTSSNGVSKTITNVAFVVTSEGPNSNLQTGTTAGVVELRQPYSSVDDQPSPVDIVEPYDDISEWVTLAQLKNSLSCAESKLEIVNTSLPDTNIGNSVNYSASIVIDGNYNAPTSDNCVFSDNKFTYSNFNISHTSTPSAAQTVAVSCSVTADGQTVSKNFAITVNSDGSDSGTTGTGTGSGTTNPGNGGGNTNPGNGWNPWDSWNNGRGRQI